jgi:hypothetical protein
VVKLRLGSIIVTVKGGIIKSSDAWLAETLTTLVGEPAPLPSDGDPDWLIAQRILRYLPDATVTAYKP